MGNILDSCTSKIDCCNKYNSDKTENNIKEDKEDKEEEDDNNDNDINVYDDSSDDDSPFEIVKRSTKNFFSYASDIKNMKLKAKLLILHKTDPWSIYKEIQDLGFGSYGIVKKICLKNDPETIRAIKIIKKAQLIEGVDDNKLIDEILILKNLDHPNIMQLYEFFEDNNNYYMVSEFCDQGDLLGKLQKLGYMNEIVVKFLMEQIFNAIAYLHSKGVFHGDIKLENIMLYSTTQKPKQTFTRINKKIAEDKTLQKEIENSFNELTSKYEPTKQSRKIVNDMLNYEIKLIDFGCSKIFTKRGERKSGIIGTSMYCSPEVIDDLYDEKCDEWSCGVLMYLLLCGEPPFQGETEEEIFKNIKKCKLDFSPPQFKNVSDNCKDLIRKLLQPKIQKRLKAIDALKHPFFKESFNPEAALKIKDKTIIRQLSDLKLPISNFHCSVISFLSANYINKDEEKKLRKVFRYIDYDDKSYLTKEKIQKVLKENNVEYTDNGIQKIFDALDIDKNGLIEYQEYIQGLCDKKALFNDFNLKNIFTIIDNDNKGYLTSDDIKSFAFPNKIVNDEAISEYLKQFGMKIDDKLSFDEFAYIIKNNCSLPGDENEREEINKSFDLKNDNEEHKLQFDNSNNCTDGNNSSDISD